MAELPTNDIDKKLRELSDERKSLITKLESCDNHIHIYDEELSLIRDREERLEEQLARVKTEKIELLEKKDIKVQAQKRLHKKLIENRQTQLRELQQREDHLENEDELTEIGSEIDEIKEVIRKLEKDYAELLQYGR